MAAAAGTSVWAGRFAGRPTAMPRRAITRFAVGPEPIQRQHVAPHAPSAMLTRLAADPVSSVQGAVAGNRGTPVAAFAALVCSAAAPWVPFRAVCNPACPLWLLERLRPLNPLREQEIKSLRTVDGSASGQRMWTRAAFWRGAAAADPSCGPLLLRLWARSRCIDVKVAVAKNRSSPPEVLDRLGSSPHTKVRHGVTSNPSTPTRTLRRLVTDPETAVRLTAMGIAIMPPASARR